jgi:site-specific recombinase XerC
VPVLAPCYPIGSGAVKENPHGLWHDLRHTFASWYMMNGGDLYELAKILGHSNIRMTERYAKLGKTHIARTGDTARGMWKLMSSEVNGERATAV